MPFTFLYTIDCVSLHCEADQFKAANLMPIIWRVRVSRPFVDDVHAVSTYCCCMDYRSILVCSNASKFRQKPTLTSALNINSFSG